MPRFLAERTFRGGLAIAANAAGAEACRRVVGKNTACGVTWLHSYVSDDLELMTCVYEAPDAASIAAAAERSGLPVDRITRVTVLDPWADAGSAPPSGAAC